jgi:hypothetical protein
VVAAAAAFMPEVLIMADQVVARVRTIPLLLLVQPDKDLPAEQDKRRPHTPLEVVEEPVLLAVMEEDLNVVPVVLVSRAASQEQPHIMPGAAAGAKPQ